MYITVEVEIPRVKFYVYLCSYTYSYWATVEITDLIIINSFLGLCVTLEKTKKMLDYI